jgi:LemA protein
MEATTGYIFVVVFLLLISVAIIGWMVTLYNSLVQVRVDVDTAWSNIDVLLKQRHDELGKLLDSVKAYMGYEQDVLTSVTRLRSQASAGGDGPARMQAEEALTGSIGRLFAVAENYPQLRASDNFKQRILQRLSQYQQRSPRAVSRHAAGGHSGPHTSRTLHREPSRDGRREHRRRP